MPTTEKLTDEEIRDLRILLKDKDRKGWLWAAIKQAALWITAVVVAFNNGYGALLKLLKFLTTSNPE